MKGEMVQTMLSAIEEIVSVTRKAGYVLYYNFQGGKYCFDVFAKRDNRLIAIKYIPNIDCFDEELANSLKLIALVFRALPLIVGEKTRHSRLETGVIYFRYEIPVVNFETFKRMILHEEYPMVYTRRGGYYVKIDSILLKELREKKGMSLGELADKVGVSRRTIYEYERNTMDATLETAIKLEEFFNASIVVPIPLLNLKVIEIDKRKLSTTMRVPENPLLKLLYSTLRRIGLKVIFFKYTPFDALSIAEEKEILSGVDDKEKKSELWTKIELVNEFSKISERAALFVVKENYKKIDVELEHVKIVTSSQLKHIKSIKHFMELIANE